MIVVSFAIVIVKFILGCIGAFVFLALHALALFLAIAIPGVIICSILQWLVDHL
jgi:hypothetical protein